MEDEAKITGYTVFDIDSEESKCEVVSFDSISDKDLLNFLKKVIVNTRTSRSTREAMFKQTSFVKMSTNEILKNKNTSNNQQNIGLKLLESEKKYSEKMQRMGKKLKKGSLVFAQVTLGGKQLVLYSKIDFEYFIKKDSFERELGLPEEKALLKSCLVYLDKDSVQENLLLSDSNGDVARYWWDEFLEVEFVRNDEKNTNEAFKQLHGKLTYIKTISPDDHTDLRNNLIGYFKTAGVFDFDKMVERVVGHFTPVSKDVNIDILKEKLYKVQEKGKFDGIFTIDPKVVKARVQKKYSLDNDVLLVTNSGTDNIYSATIGKEHYVLVKSESGSSDFKKLELPKS
jgi:hypothetical protein